MLRSHTYQAGDAYLCVFLLYVLSLSHAQFKCTIYSTDLIRSVTIQWLIQRVTHFLDSKNLYGFVSWK